MNLPKSLTNRLRRTLKGPMWHGPAVNELLENVTAADAVARPIAHAHTIWELVLHIAVWAEIARERMAGRSVKAPPPELDFPPAPTPVTEEGWHEARNRLTTAYNAFADDVKRLTPEALNENVNGEEYSVAELISGVVEHGTYHGGQIALLKRALVESHIM